MEVIRKETMEGTAIRAMTEGRGASSIMVLRLSCRARSASVMGSPPFRPVQPVSAGRVLV